MSTSSITRSSRWSAAHALALLVCCAAAGCGAAVVPQELHNARDAYKRASTGPAAQLAPAQLDTARQALERADMAQTKDDDPAVVRDLAYVAERQAAIAESSAALEQAMRDAATYERERGELQRDELVNMKQELRKQKEELQSEREARVNAEKKAAAALQSLDEIGRVKEEARGIVITLSGQVLFATGTYELLSIAKVKLNDVAKALIDQGDSTIVVEGHTDSRGSDRANEQLSLQRAQEVRGYLVSQGVPSESIRAAGLGESRPIASNESAEGRANNRRVEIIVKPKSAKSDS